MRTFIIRILLNILDWLNGGKSMHSKYFEKVKMWYEKGLWSLDMVFSAVPKMITADEYLQITGREYEFEEQY